MAMNGRRAETASWTKRFGADASGPLLDFSPPKTRELQNDALKLIATDVAPCLLSGVTCGSANLATGVSACVIDENGNEVNSDDLVRRRSGGSSSDNLGDDSVRLGDLVKNLWPKEEKEHLPRSRTLRFLSDDTKQDFLLRLTPQAILIRSDFVRAMVEPTRVIFLCTNNQTFKKFKEEFQQFLGKYKSNGQLGCCFSTVVIESIVCATVTLQTMRLAGLKHVSENMLANLRPDKSEDSILKLYPMKVAVSSLIERLRPVVQCLQTLLNAEADRDETKNSPLSLVDGLEDVLEHWCNNAKEVYADAEEICAKIEDARQFLEGSLSCTRNRLLMFELAITVATLAMTLGALVSGIFGMNLRSGIEDWHGPFYVVLVGIAIAGFLIATISAFFVGRSKRHYGANSASFGKNKFFKRINEDEYVLVHDLDMFVRDCEVPVGDADSGVNCCGPRQRRWLPSHVGANHIEFSRTTSHFST